jgi:hypothetical protein
MGRSKADYVEMPWNWTSYLNFLFSHDLTPGKLAKTLGRDRVLWMKRVSNAFNPKVTEATLRLHKEELVNLSDAIGTPIPEIIHWPDEPMYMPLNTIQMKYGVPREGVSKQARKRRLSWHKSPEGELMVDVTDKVIGSYILMNVAAQEGRENRSADQPPAAPKAPTADEKKASEEALDTHDAEESQSSTDSKQEPRLVRIHPSHFKIGLPYDIDHLKIVATDRARRIVSKYAGCRFVMDDLTKYLGLPSSALTRARQKGQLSWFFTEHVIHGGRYRLGKKVIKDFPFVLADEKLLNFISGYEFRLSKGRRNAIARTKAKERRQLSDSIKHDAKTMKPAQNEEAEQTTFEWGEDVKDQPEKEVAKPTKSKLEVKKKPAVKKPKHPPIEKETVTAPSVLRVDFPFADAIKDHTKRLKEIKEWCAVVDDERVGVVHAITEDLPARMRRNHNKIVNAEKHLRAVGTCTERLQDCVDRIDGAMRALTVRVEGLEAGAKTPLQDSTKISKGGLSAWQRICVWMGGLDR